MKRILAENDKIDKALKHSEKNKILKRPKLIPKE